MRKMESDLAVAVKSDDLGPRQIGFAWLLPSLQHFSWKDDRIGSLGQRKVQPRLHTKKGAASAAVGDRDSDFPSFFVMLWFSQCESNCLFVSFIFCVWACVAMVLFLLSRNARQKTTLLVRENSRALGLYDLECTSSVRKWSRLQTLFAA